MNPNLYDAELRMRQHRALAQAAEQRRFGVEPAQALTEGRPTKRDRRELADWQRWSAYVDDSTP